MRYFLLVINIFFFLCFISACSPEAGYDYCKKETETGGDAFVSAEIQITDIHDKHGGKKAPFVESISVDYKCTGTHAYIYKGISSWDEIICYKSQCVGGELLPALQGEYEIASGIGSHSVKLPMFVCFDTHTIDENNWAQVNTNYGWRSKEDFVFEIVECKENIHCSSDTVCVDNKCKIIECSPGEEKCEGNEYKECTSEYSWKNLGKVVGKCDWVKKTHYKFLEEENECIEIGLFPNETAEKNVYSIEEECDYQTKTKIEKIWYDLIKWLKNLF